MGFLTLARKASSGFSIKSRGGDTDARSHQTETSAVPSSAGDSTSVSIPSSRRPRPRGKNSFTSRFSGLEFSLSALTKAEGVPIPGVELQTDAVDTADTKSVSPSFLSARSWNQPGLDPPNLPVKAASDCEASMGHSKRASASRISVRLRTLSSAQKRPRTTTSVSLRDLLGIRKTDGKEVKGDSEPPMPSPPRHIERPKCLSRMPSPPLPIPTVQLNSPSSATELNIGSPTLVQDAKQLQAADMSDIMKRGLIAAQFTQPKAKAADAQRVSREIDITITASAPERSLASPRESSASSTRASPTSLMQATQCAMHTPSPKTGWLELDSNATVDNSDQSERATSETKPTKRRTMTTLSMFGSSRTPLIGDLPPVRSATGSTLTSETDQFESISKPRFQGNLADVRPVSAVPSMTSVSSASGISSKRSASERKVKRVPPPKLDDEGPAPLSNMPMLESRDSLISESTHGYSTETSQALNDDGPIHDSPSTNESDLIDMLRTESDAAVQRVTSLRSSIALSKISLHSSLTSPDSTAENKQRLANARKPSPQRPLPLQLPPPSSVFESTARHSRRESSSSASLAYARSDKLPFGHFSNDSRSATTKSVYQAAAAFDIIAGDRAAGTITFAGSTASLSPECESAVSKAQSMASLSRSMSASKRNSVAKQTSAIRRSATQPKARPAASLTYKSKQEDSAKTTPPRAPWADGSASQAIEEPKAWRSQLEESSRLFTCALKVGLSASTPTAWRAYNSADCTAPKAWQGELLQFYTGKIRERDLLEPEVQRHIQARLSKLAFPSGASIVKATDMRPREIGLFQFDIPKETMPTSPVSHILSASISTPSHKRAARRTIYAGVYRGWIRATNDEMMAFQSSLQAGELDAETMQYLSQRLVQQSRELMAGDDSDDPQIPPPTAHGTLMPGQAYKSRPQASHLSGVLELWLPRACIYCSDYPIFDTLVLCAKSSFEEDLKSAQQLMQTPVPLPGTKFLVAPPGRGQAFSAQMPALVGLKGGNKALPELDFQPCSMLSMLSIDALITIAEVASAQGRVLFISKDPAIRDLAVLTFQRITAVADWDGLACSIIHPRDLQQYLLDPGAWLYAIDERTAQTVALIDELDCLIVWLDTCVLKCSAGCMPLVSRGIARDRKIAELDKTCQQLGGPASLSRELASEQSDRNATRRGQACKEVWYSRQYIIIGALERLVEQKAAMVPSRVRSLFSKAPTIDSVSQIGKRKTELGRLLGAAAIDERDLAFLSAQEDAQMAAVLTINCRELQQAQRAVLSLASRYTNEHQNIQRLQEESRAAVAAAKEDKRRANREAEHSQKLVNEERLARLEALRQLAVEANAKAELQSANAAILQRVRKILSAKEQSHIFDNVASLCDETASILSSESEVSRRPRAAELTIDSDADGASDGNSSRLATSVSLKKKHGAIRETLRRVSMDLHAVLRDAGAIDSMPQESGPENTSTIISIGSGNRRASSAISTKASKASLRSRRRSGVRQQSARERMPSTEGLRAAHMKQSDQGDALKANNEAFEARLDEWRKSIDPDPDTNPAVS
ncbi:uncharacterized protein L969DRAFT_54734 [Mixia osmundae IAM 14324]|uniref:Uncharacterized protein n=1 Tax=Mixia osmundae (strain CBS 9802 / IAM 14324 / JCM 22182 / KY 12970) TaxID=764103 RepID=G7DW68_MIXOS|nr:uncharacterized protein L969DRAFT_54734 [Mixia osmundae IAM 14324]KEI36427.1 hypothetical protein L969DRAFT_54734 [Mixia osmundae IAM 14324]GAA94874.1 hypothetical protein E5Q_01529 [Mixia osmundae IAM 14324]